MTLPMNNTMKEALRLTRTGQLEQATALIQKKLSGDARANSTKKGVPLLLNTASTVKMPTRQKADNFRVLPSAFTDLFSAKKVNSSPREKCPRPGQFLYQTYQNAVGTRQYKLYVPQYYTGQSMPLIIMLHGCTQSADDFAVGTRMNQFADQQGFLVAYPEQPNNANASKCWNWFNPTDQHQGGGEPSLIAGITRHIIEEYQIDPDRIYIGGLSAGGAAAAIMATAYPDLYAAVGIHSGLACGSAHDLQSALSAMNSGAAGKPCQKNSTSVPTIVFHGDQDRTVHPSNGEHILNQLNIGEKRSVETGHVSGGYSYTRIRYNDNEGRNKHEQWVIHGAGHAWSGGSRHGSFTDPKGVDASKEMVRFFLEHSAG